ncbi:MAG: glycosyltransferase family 2 protein [Lachnospiraceae bacterium]
MAKLLIIIPAYNEELNIEKVVDRLEKEYSQYDYLVVNDGSRDQTAFLCRKNGYHMVDLPLNLGLAGAFQTGIKYAYAHDYDFAVQFDGDGQHRPEYFASMIEKMEEGYDIVIGSRFVHERKPKSMRMLGSNLIQAAILLTTGRKICDPTSGMRMFNRNMIREFACNINYAPEPDTLSFLLKNGAKVAEVPVKMDERLQGASYLTPINAGKYMFRMLLSILFIQNFRRKEKRKPL